ncbi:signal transduction histidine kinase [Acidovorax sp. CF316]|uniref:sensor histidine kinase n=1 Tax=Acidovorax sp. CF316 TaxID=1144317 RepID=UPI00026BE537|nr:ATP-binding protein [Acidovorax sp. CF316]EJE50991.1 signal transduction histidine kinase [Acidovorax sp. CF316]
MKAQLEQSQAEVEALQSEMQALREELEETNRGVVALYAELDEQAEQLKHATQLKSRFLSYMSHEFRTPIGATLSLVRLLLDRVDGPLTEEQERQVRFIQTTSEEFSSMVDDLLDLAKIEAGRLDVSPAWFEMMDLFTALRGMFKPIVENQDLSLVFEEPVGLSRLYNDDRKLSQILRNFISNALKFTARGEVRVSVTLEGEGMVRFAVSDTGIGIAPEHLPVLFNDFSQVEAPVRKPLRGTGLGLALSKQLATLLGGSIDVRSVVGEGSVFSVIVPVELSPAAAGGRVQA